MASIKVLLNKSRIKNDKTYPLVFQVIHGRRKKLIYSKYHLREEDFNDHTGRVSTRRGRRPALLAEIDECILDTCFDLNKVILELESRNLVFTVDDIIIGRKLKNKNHSVLNYIGSVAVLLKSSGKGNTACSYKSTYNRLAGYINNDEEFLFLDITSTWLQEFVDFLYSEGLCTSSAGFYLRVLSASYNRAIEDGLFELTGQSPFAKVKIAVQKTAKRAVCSDTIIAIAKADLSSEPKLCLSRDLFMASFYCRGMSFVDLSKLKWSDVKDGDMTYIRSKTGQSICVEIGEALMTLFLRYKTDSEYVFPILVSDTKSHFTQYRTALRRTNERLAELAVFLNIPDKLTTYVARHSWATIAKELGVSLTVISESLGHTSEKTTMIYLKELDRSVLHKANALVCDHVSL